MKTIQRLLSVTFLMILLAGILVMPANAASITQDGLVITLETDKQSYAQDELIHATATVKNTNSTDVSAVSIEPLIPAGYELTIRDSSSQSTVLKAVEIMTSTFVLEPQIGSNTAVAASQTLTHAEETPAPEAAQPASRSRSVLPIIIVAVLVIVLLAVVILSGVWKRFLALLLCSAMLYTSLPSVALQADAAEQNVRTAKISTDITVGDKKVTLEARVSYEQPVDVVTVSFNTNNSSTTASVSVEKGKSISKPANPTRSGYTFLGWFLDRALTRKFRFSDPITESITLYAGWKAKTGSGNSTDSESTNTGTGTATQKPTYSVTFETNGGSSIAAATVQKGNTVATPTTPTREGYNFAGWYADADLTVSYDFSKTVTQNLTLYAAWDAKGAVHTVTLDLGISGIVADKHAGLYAPQQVVEGYTAKKPRDPQPLLGTFAGWYTTASRETPYDFSSAITQDTTIYADWTFDNTDSDADGLPDECEDYLNLSRNSPDTDNDGLDDLLELQIGTDPKKADTDGNGTKDCDEDFDRDTLTNGREAQLSTDPLRKDSDGDFLNDIDELTVYGTDPAKRDTDADGADDRWELDNGFDPLVYNDSFLVSDSSEPVSQANPVSASVQLTLSGDQVTTLNVRPVTASVNPMMTANIAGYLGCAYDFSVDGSFSSAEMTFHYDPSLGEISPDFQPRIYYFNEETATLEELPDQSVSNGQVSVSVSHFSTYLLLNKVEFDKIWKQDIKVSGDDDTAKNLRIAFVVDTSGSMSGHMATVKSVMQTFINAMSDEDQAAIIGFYEVASLASPLTNVKSQLLNVVNRLHASGGTSIHSGVTMGIDQLLKNRANPSAFAALCAEDTEPAADAAPTTDVSPAPDTEPAVCTEQAADEELMSEEMPAENTESTEEESVDEEVTASEEKPADIEESAIDEASANVEEIADIEETADEEVPADDEETVNDEEAADGEETADGEEAADDEETADGEETADDEETTESEQPAAYAVMAAEDTQSTNSYDVLLLLTDGADSNFNNYWKTHADNCANNQITAYSIGIGNSVSSSHLTQFAEGTGGKYYHATVIGELEDYFEDITNETVGLLSDTNNDGISDYHTELIRKGELVLSYGSVEFTGIDFNYNAKGEPSADYDGDGLLNGEEIEVNKDGDRTYLYMHSNPMLKHSDTDGYSDYQEQKKMARNPLIHEYARDSVEFLLEDTEFLHAGYAETYNWDGDESMWTFVQGILSGVFNVTELYRDMLTEYLATYSENVDKPNEELRKIMVGWLDELYALGIASANELGDQHKIGGYINDINNLRNIINGGSYSVTAVYTDCEKLVAFANQYFPKKTVLKIRTPEMGNIAWKAAFSELDSFDPKGIGKTVAFDALSGGVDIATTLDAFTKVHANMNAFERSAIFLDKLSNSYNNQMSKAAQDVLSEMGGAFGKEMKKAIVSDAVEMSINIALSIAACNPYVAAVLFAKSLFVGILKVEDTVKNKHAMVAYYEMAYGYTLCVYESGWAVTKRYYHDKNGQLGYYLANMAQVRILGERKYALYEPDEKDQADSNITDVVNAVRNLEVTFSPSFH